jgi:hypothetical protein
MIYKVSFEVDSNLKLEYFEEEIKSKLKELGLDYFQLTTSEK